jgi:hypothetical protein
VDGEVRIVKNLVNGKSAILDTGRVVCDKTREEVHIPLHMGCVNTNIHVYFPVNKKSRQNYIEDEYYRENITSIMENEIPCDERKVVLCVHTTDTANVDTSDNTNYITDLYFITRNYQATMDDDIKEQLSEFMSLDKPTTKTQSQSCEKTGK